MTNHSYKIIRKALIEQKKRVAASPKEATKLINDLGIRHIIVGGKITTRSVKKAPAKKGTC